MRSISRTKLHFARRRLVVLALVVVAGSSSLGNDRLEDASRGNPVAQRRASTAVIVHRGSSEFAHENTLEAYRASFDLGADGNEIDIRVTRDGVLVCFHDDLLDHLLEAFGDVSEHDWADLQTYRFRRPGWFGESCRIPTLEEVFTLHKQHAGLMHLDIKRPGLEKPIISLLDRMELWDNVVAVNGENGPEIAKHPKCKLARYKGSLYADRAEVDPAAIAAMLQKPGEMVIVDDPRGTLVELGRKLGKVSLEPVTRIKRPVPKLPPDRSVQELVAILRDDADWDSVPRTDAEKSAKAQSILRRAQAAEEIRRRKLCQRTLSDSAQPGCFKAAESAELVAALENRVRRRSLHPEWMYQGLDGAIAFRALAEFPQKSAPFLELARFCLRRDDPIIEAVVDPRWKNPRPWTDFRTKMIVFPLLERFPGELLGDAAQVCRDYLALSDEDATRFSPLQFEQAAKALLAIEPGEPTALELLKHRRADVRGRAILECLSHSNRPWARSALEKSAPHALKYVVSP